MENRAGWSRWFVQGRWSRVPVSLNCPLSVLVCECVCVCVRLCVSVCVSGSHSHATGLRLGVSWILSLCCVVQKRWSRCLIEQPLARVH
jgi:hypothetical protein